MVAIAAFVVVIAGMRAATTIVVPFLLAAFIAIISAPPMFWLHRKGLPVWFSLLLVIVAVVLIGLLISGLVGSSVKVFTKELPVQTTPNSLAHRHLDHKARTQISVFLFLLFSLPLHHPYYL